ncbi:MAG: ArsR family transcriptional regulator [Methanothrix sp.]
MNNLVSPVVMGLKKVPLPDPSDEQEEFSSILMEIGLRRNVAKVLTYLAGVVEATSRDIETNSDLRQPEVSIAMRELRELGWISERDEKNPGKGRPYRIYRLEKSVDEIIKYLEDQKLQDIERTMRQIERLKELRSAAARGA